ncbi:hypothetical protein R6Q57_001117 [Mikania cordata]
MDVELNTEELKHEHPLTFVDLQLLHRGYEEDDEDYNDNDLIEAQNFESTCNRCGTRIDWYHRYYYRCSMMSCDYSLHKFCENMPKTLTFQGHPSHTLRLKKTTKSEKCHVCLKQYQDNIGYHCYTCNYGIDLQCATIGEQNTIHHPCHPHPLICVTIEPGLNKCLTCGKKHEGYFYHCPTCSNFLICSECLVLPLKLSLETKQFSHRHLLTLSYSFVDTLYDFECRICGIKLEDEPLIYKCSKCMYYVHPDCATQRAEPFMSILLPAGLGKTEKNFRDDDHPNLLHFPLPDESHILPHQTAALIATSQYINHEHKVLLMRNDSKNVDIDSTGLVFVHDSMKRIKLLCNACSRPITDMPFYKCSSDSNDCNFALHYWCTWLPKEIRNHVGHPQHMLELHPVNDYVFECCVCRLPSNGFSYRCNSCDSFIMDVNCAFIPEEITHEAHENHLLSRVDASLYHLSNIECRACRVSIDESEIYFKCRTCDFYLDCRCALHLPKTMRHKFDKHPLTLSYYPVEDHKSQYFCEICEEDLDPVKWFYHCVECKQSIHSACAPLILQSEQNVNSHYVEGVYKFINIKFGAIRLHHHHDPDPHNMAFAPGTKNDGKCGSCPLNLHSHMIWKCSVCEFSQHYYTCTTFKSRLPIWAHHLYFPGKKHTRTHGSQLDVRIYPSEVIRPVTRHWKVVN